ncbi:MAG: DUF1553 domain-containing protein [Planctomycetaceae bacterium]
MNRRVATVAIPAAVLILAPAMSFAADEKVDFNRDIRPLLSDRCFQCHGPDEKQRQAGLRLDRREAAVAKLDSGETAVVPGRPAESELVRRIVAEDEFTRMPPPDSGKSLSKDEIELLRRWIEQGAEFQAHWAFVTPRRPNVPQVGATRTLEASGSLNRNESRRRNAIDGFVLARLEQEGLSPSPEADRRTLIRRVTFDLTGLPPTREEIAAFLADEAPDAYERLVDRLLSSPHFGEHMARYWLDAVRYGDTHGLHLDNYREIWPYRDWVIRAFNENKPYDEFVVEQLAGDLLPAPTTAQLVATGFNRCNVSTNEGGSIEEEVYVRNVVDRVEAASTVFMGLTAGCAVCHDHKFDPLTQQEFYGLFAFFNSIDGKELDGNKKDHAPVVRVPQAEHETQLAKFDADLAAIARALETREASAPADLESWLAEAEKQARTSGDAAGLAKNLIAHFPLDEADGENPADALDPERKGRIVGKVERVAGKTGRALRFDGGHVELGDAGRFEKDRPVSYGAWIRTTGEVTGSPLGRMDEADGHRGWDLYLVGKKVAMHLIHRWPGDALKVTTQEDVLEPNAWHHVFVTYDGSAKATGVTVYVDGRRREVDVNNNALQGTTVTDTPLRLGKRSAQSPFTGGTIDDVRLYDRELSADEVAHLAGSSPVQPILALPADERSPEQRQALRWYFLQNEDEAYRKLLTDRDRVEADKTKVHDQMPVSLVFREGKSPKPAYLLIRGEYDKKGDQVERGVPSFLPPMADDLPRDRLGLARWLVDPRHPLTSRAAVNRYWQQCFGTGLVKTSEDFGAQGEWPSHPELLDWLAVDFRESGWDVKRMMKLIVTSATYRQSSRVAPELLRKDPRNRLLARGPRFRFDAEMIRDQALAVSRLLVRTIGGPSVKPPQPEGLWEAVGYTSSNTAKFKPDTGDKLYRRSVYTFWKRTSAPPTMTAFDAPSREACQIRRERTNTPLQALVLMNEPQFFEAARHLAQRTMKEAGESPAERVAWMFEEATARPADSDERAILRAAYEGNLEEYRANPTAAAKLIRSGDTPPDASLPPEDLAAWTMLANAVLNLDEVVVKD